MPHTFTTARGTRTVLADTPAELREYAEREKTRALDSLRRAEENLAEAERWAAEQEAHAKAARGQRNERAARTRAHNKDPFGFKGAGYTD